MDRIEALEQTIRTKAQQTSIDEIQETMQLLPTKQEVIELRSHVKSSLQTFSD